MAGKFVGTSVRRVDDVRILAGQGRFVADVTARRVVHAAFVRSPFPHARITGIDTGAARALEGVTAVLTAADLAPLATPMMVMGGAEGYRSPLFTALATDRVRFVGDLVAIVVAETRARAEDAADAVVVDYEPLDAVVDAEAGAGPDAPVLFDDLGSNVLYDDTFTAGDVDAAFAGAARVVKARFRQHRHAHVPMETRGGMAEWSPTTRELTYTVAHQLPHLLRLMLAGLLQLPTASVRVVTPDIGGAFGQKTVIGREDVAVCAASKLLGRPVKWVEDRYENLTAGGQAREEDVELEAAVTDDGVILGLRAWMRLDHGAYPIIPYPASVYCASARVMLPATYRIPALAFRSTVVATNKCSYLPYRGPWEVETFARERMLDLVADDLGLDRVEVRRRNLLTAEELPTKLITGPDLEGIPGRLLVERAVELAGYESFAAEQEQARAEGRYLGLGLASYLEPAPGPPSFGVALGFPFPPERAHVRLEPDGSASVVTSQSPHGQGHHTTLAQLVADELSLPLEQVRVVVGDTSVTPIGFNGTAGSRAATMASGAVVGAARDVRQQIFRIASGMLEAAEADLEMVDGSVQVKGVPAAAVPVAQIAMAAYMMPGMVLPDGSQGIAATHDFQQPPGGWSQATHCCWVEVDLGTGEVKILRYLVVEDCGRIINPAIVAGQIRGGVAQGIAGVLYERSAYDDDGQYLASTFMDYLVPTAMEIPPIEIHHLESDGAGELDFRGVGEGGAVGAPAAVVNAIANALSPFGARVTESHLPPARVLELAGVIPT